MRLPTKCVFVNSTEMDPVSHSISFHLIIIQMNIKFGHIFVNLRYSVQRFIKTVFHEGRVCLLDKGHYVCLDYYAIQHGVQLYWY